MSNIDEKKAPIAGEDDADTRNADSAFDDLIIEVDESELESELHGSPPDRKA
jgi:hypothetical protein